MEEAEMGGAVGEVLPLALAVTISPLPIIAEILLLFTGKPKANAGAYLLGFVAGVAVVLVILFLVAGSQDLTDPGSDSSTGAAWVKVAVGLALVVAGVRRFRNRPRGDPEEEPMPKWMSGIQSFEPTRSLAIGFAIGAVNPKNVAVGLAAALVVASSGLAGGKEAVTLAVYVIVASLGVAAPFVVAVAMGKGAAPILEGWRTWLRQNNAAVMAVLFLVFGVLIFGKGLAGI
jgi:Sap, sulfolipid-1-addressing protein